MRRSRPLPGTDGIADGTIRSDAGAEETAVAVLAQLRGIGLQRLVDSPAVDTERLRHAVTEYWRLALALANRASPHALGGRYRTG